MNNQARSCKLKCKYNVQGICNIYGECIAKDLFIEELEKIKAEINEQIDFNESCCERTDLYEAIGIINRRISELKGEDK